VRGGHLSGTPDVRSRIRGCILGGAVGDALGAPVEFMGLDEIRSRFGPDGPSDFEGGAHPAGSITDDTQRTCGGSLSRAPLPRTP
jgi:ADP-ribosylglycohydrolase